MEPVLRDGGRRAARVRSMRWNGSICCTATAILNAASGDSWFVLASERLADSQSQPQIFSYTFNWKSPAYGGVLGSCHALDIPFTFGRQAMMPDFAGSGPDADALAHLVMDSWTAFARSGDPSTPEWNWPAYNTETRSRVMLGQGACRRSLASRRAGGLGRRDLANLGRLVGSRQPDQSITPTVWRPTRRSCPR